MEDKSDIIWGIPWFLGALIFVNALVGAGILNFPYSIHAAGGIYVAMTVQLVSTSLFLTECLFFQNCYSAVQNRVDVLEMSFAGNGLLIMVFCYQCYLVFALTRNYTLSRHGPCLPGQLRPISVQRHHVDLPVSHDHHLCHCNWRANQCRFSGISEQKLDNTWSRCLFSNAYWCYRSENYFPRAG